MVHRWGAYAGPSDELRKADANSPKGYWEFLPLWDLLAELGDFASGATWWDRDFEQRMEEKALDPACRARATDLMSRMDRGGPWFWKDPALVHFLPFWKRMWRDAAYVITVRNPRDIAVSWQKFAVPSNVKVRFSFVAMNLLRWQHMMTLILKHTEDAAHRCFSGTRRSCVNHVSRQVDCRTSWKGSLRAAPHVPRRWRRPLILDCGETTAGSLLRKCLKLQIDRRPSMPS